MTHTLKLTNGARTLAVSILRIPEGLKTPSEILRAAHLIDNLGVDEKSTYSKEWADTDTPDLEITEAQRDLLKKIISDGTNATKIPPSKYAESLLTQLGFSEV